MTSTLATAKLRTGRDFSASFEARYSSPLGGAAFHCWPALGYTVQNRPEKPDPQPFTKGLVSVFTGNGKGKTSAALGIALRAVGQGLRVNIVYFMKGDYPYGEQKALVCLPNIAFTRFGHLHFVDPQNVKPEEREEAEKALAAARQAMLSGQYDVIVLDEVNVAAAWKLVPLEDVLKLLRDKPERVELILTGRHAPPEILEMADLVTEMREIKHPYQKGIPSRKGIDF